MCRGICEPAQLSLQMLRSVGAVRLRDCGPFGGAGGSAPWRIREPSKLLLKPPGCGRRVSDGSFRLCFRLARCWVGDGIGKPCCLDLKCLERARRRLRLLSLAGSWFIVFSRWCVCVCVCVCVFHSEETNQVWSSCSDITVVSHRDALVPRTNTRPE